MKTVTCNQCHTVIYKSRMNELPPASILCPECHTMHKDKPEMTKFRKMLNGVEFIVVSGGFIAVMKISQSLDLFGIDHYFFVIHSFGVSFVYGNPDPLVTEKYRHGQRRRIQER